MTDEIKTGGPAFPQSGAISGAGDVWMSSELGGSGLTIRDYFAKEALGLCYAQYLNYAEVEGFHEDWRTRVALNAYLMADAMIKARG